jgi:REP element-mobilizing transposase RayT
MYTVHGARQISGRSRVPAASGGSIGSPLDNDVMKNNPRLRHRRSIRLKGYDYSKAGAYFVSICVQKRECLLGDIVNDEMVLNDVGRVVSDSWTWLGTQYDHVELDEYMIMPNHLHGVVIIQSWGGSRTALPSSQTAPTSNLKSLGRIIGAFKTVSTKHINEMRRTPSVRLWQRNYYEHIVRDENELMRIREYMENNPLKWEFDRENPNGKRDIGYAQRPDPAKDEPWRI